MTKRYRVEVLNEGKTTEMENGASMSTRGCLETRIDLRDNKILGED